MVADFDRKENREIFKKRFWFKVGGIFLIVVFVLFGVANIKLYEKKRELKLRIEAYQRQIEEMKKSNQTLQGEIANADDVDYLEKLGYEQFNQARPGETEYIFIEEDSVINISQNEPEKKSFLEKIFSIWDWIKSKF